MKHYQMATLQNPSITKQPLKHVELPVRKFAEEAIPYHQKVFEEHKSYVHKQITLNKTEQLSKEIKAKKRNIKQIRDMMYELDTLRTQVEDEDINQFDTKTIPLRNAFLKLIKGYQDLEKTVENIVSTIKTNSESELNENQNPFEGVAQIQTQESLDELRLKQKQELLQRVEDVQRETEDLHDIYKDLHGVVKEQGESVEQVENNVEEAQENVTQGLHHLIKANNYRLKTVAYPVTGAFLGTLLGGPIGLVAGLKVGGAAALGCALAGYSGGLFLKKQKEVDTAEGDAISNNENNENYTVTQNMKKDM